MPYTPPMILQIIDAEDFFRGIVPGTPSGVASLQAGLTDEGCGSLQVTAAIRASDLAIEAVDHGEATNYGDEAGMNGWGGVIEHDDGTIGIYTAYDISDSTISVHPRLLKPATGRRLSNLFNSYHGQHLTRIGYQALARFLASQTRRQCLSATNLQYHLYEDDVQMVYGTDWALAGGLVQGGLVPGSTISRGYYPSQAISSPYTPELGANKYTGPDRSFYLGHRRKSYVGAGTAGEGISQTVALGDACGGIDLLVAVRGQSGTIEGSRVRVRLVVDTVTVFDTIVAGLRRLVIPFDRGITAVLSITLLNNAPTAFCVTRCIWYTSTDEHLDVPVLQDGAKICVACDSWGTYYGGVLAAELAKQLPHSTIINVSVGGQTAKQALIAYDAVVPDNADYVIFNHLINDKIDCTPAQWVSDIQALAAHALAAGQCPVLLTGHYVASDSAIQAMMPYWDHLRRILAGVT